VAIIAAISADSHRPYLEAKEDVLLESDVEALSQIIEAVTKNNIPGVLQNREISLSAAYTAVAWMSCENWQAFRGLLFLNGVTEGDAARLITQTAEQLNQIARLVQTHPELAQQAEIARLRILRPPLTEAINVEAV
jgi:hypothetical protein